MTLSSIKAALTYPQVNLRIGEVLGPAERDVPAMFFFNYLSFSKATVCRLLPRVLAGFS